MKTDAVYARQSVEKKDSLSIAGQIDLCRRTAGGGELRVYKDAGYSGKNTERPAFQQLMKDIRADRIGTLYVYRLDRFSRSVADFGQLWEVLQEHHVEFVSVNENFDTKTPMGRAMLHIIMVFAQLERETTAERVRDNYYRRAALGAWPGGPAPYGFDNGRARGRDGSEVPSLIPNDKAEVVQRIFREYAAEGMSLGRLARKLTTEGIPAPKRATWDNVTLSRLLHNPAYVMADEQVRLHYLGQGVEVTSPPEAFDGVHGVLLVGKREANARKYTKTENHRASVLSSVGVVPSSLFLAVQAKLAHNRQVGNSGKGKHTWLSGLLKCAKCGYSLSVVVDKSYRYLACSGRYNMNHCDATIHVKLAELEAVVQTEIEKLLTQCPQEPVVPKPEEDSYTQRLLELDRRAERLMDAFAESEDLPTSYLQKALGYSMLGMANEECMFILHGKTTRNGKSTMLSAIHHLLGDYASVSPVSIICKAERSKNAEAANPMLASLKGKRFVTMAESNQYGKLDEETIKQLTGGEEIKARNLYETATTFLPQFTLWLSCNDLPTVSDKSLFASDRVRVIEFNRHFTEAEQDKNLKNEFQTQEAMQGIFAWLVAGYFKYKRFGLKMSPAMRKVVNQYERDNDLCLQFLEERLSLIHI